MGRRQTLTSAPHRMNAMIRVELPQHLRTLAHVGREVQIEIDGSVTQRSVLDALEARYPMLRGTIRDHDTRQRRAFLRFFACEEDLSHESPDSPLPDAVASGKEPFPIIGAIAGGWSKVHFGRYPSHRKQTSCLHPTSLKTRHRRRTGLHHTFRHMIHSWSRLALLALFAVVILAPFSRAQDNYEIQVYGSETVAPRSTMVEIHSNFTVDGSKTVQDGMLPTDHAEHETLEITQGINDWAEVGFYVFSSIQADGGWQWVGDHIRPRVRAPERWHWPVGVSLSTEFGYQRAAFSPDTWTWEIRPIVDRKIGPWYLAFNPALDRSFHGPGVNQGVTFSPNVKISYDFTRKVAGGLEYYASYGSLAGFDALRDQQQQFFPTIDVDFGPQWEFNFGVGVGTTPSTDHLIVKCIVGRRFSWPNGKSAKLKPAQP